MTEEERTGQASEVDEEIESFTSENFEEDVNKKKDEDKPAEEEAKKDEL